jgi:hypothetical protein
LTAAFRKLFFLLTFGLVSLNAVCDFPLYQYGSHWYTHISSKLTWDEANVQAQKIGGYLAIPDSAAENQWFYNKGWRLDWLGIYDPMRTENYCLTASTCVADDSRFRTVKGAAPTYRNWTAGEPNNLLLPEDKDPNTGDYLFSPVGEHWVVIGPKGTWGDYGNHGNSYEPIFKTTAIVEFDSEPSCNGATGDDNASVPDIFCVADANGDGTAQDSEVNDCSQSTDGFICNADMSACEPKYADANCTNGGEVNPDRDMCELEGSISCPSDYTFDASADLCYKDVLCPVAAPCSSSNYVSAGEICIDEAQCPTGLTFNTAKMRCEMPANSACPSGFTYNSSVGKCESLINPTANKCSGTASFYGSDTFSLSASPGGTAGHDTPPCAPGVPYATFTVAFDQSCNVVSTTWGGGGSICLKDTVKVAPGGVRDFGGGSYFKNTSNLCPAGYTWTGSKCRKRVNPSCSTSAAPLRDGSQCYNSASCLDGGTFNSITGQCEMDWLGGFSGELGACISEWSPKCVSGYTLSGNLCLSSPRCPSGTTYDPNQNRCEMPANSACKSGTTYNSATGYCEYSASKKIAGYNWVPKYGAYGPVASLYPNTTKVPLNKTVGWYQYEYVTSNLLTEGCGMFSSYGVMTKINSSGNIVGSYGDVAFCTALSKANFVILPNPVSGGTNRNPKDDFTITPYYGYSCPSGGTLSGQTCRISPSCATSSAPLRDGGQCYNSASCLSGGSLNYATDKCEKPYIKDCPDGGVYDPATDRCSEAVDCNPGTLDNNNSRCIIPDTINEDTCPDGYQYSPYPVGKCEAVPICDTGVYIPDATSVPRPYNNTRDHTVTDKCYLGEETCPHGDQYECSTLASDNLNYCSPWTCADSSGISYFGSPQGTSDKKPDGKVDEDGCHGQIYIFNGKDYRCRADDTFFGLTGGGCCDKDKVFGGLVACKQEEKELAAQNKKDLCVKIGTYCSKELDLLLTTICIQHSEGHCCFKSILARIIHEQGRPQMNIAWGSPENPQCRGFKPEEFEKIDFSQIDFSEFVDYTTQSMSTKSKQFDAPKSNITNEANKMIQGY